VKEVLIINKIICICERERDRESSFVYNISGSRRPSILPVPDMLTSSTLHLPGQESLDHEADESEDEMDDDVPWRSPSEKIA